MATAIQTPTKAQVTQRLDDSLNADMKDYFLNFLDSARTAERFWMRDLLMRHYSVGSPTTNDGCLIADIADELNGGKKKAR